MVITIWSEGCPYLEESTVVQHMVHGSSFPLQVLTNVQDILNRQGCDATAKQKKVLTSRKQMMVPVQDPVRQYHSLKGTPLPIRSREYILQRHIRWRDAETLSCVERLNNTSASLIYTMILLRARGTPATRRRQGCDRP